MSERIERCETCRWWDEDPDDEDGRKGDCRRYPPQVVSMQRYLATGNTGDVADDHLPFTAANDWCGEWQPKPIQKPKGCPKMRTPRVVADELGLPPWGFKKIRMFARRAGVEPAAMADNIPLYDLAGVEKMREWILLNRPAIVGKSQPSPPEAATGSQT